MDMVIMWLKIKNIADENYRKILSDTIGIGTEIKVDNKTYKKIATNTYRNKDDLYESVDYYLNQALNFVETNGSKKGNEHRFVVVANSKGNKPSEKLSIILI